ncbi:MAG: SulP family inorganic anion transporter [Chitinophagales bacterium]
MQLKNYLPILKWLPDYNKQKLRGDLIAGFTTGVMLVPQAMAYAMIAGLPPIYGLYAALIPLIIYAIFGTSMQLAVGPVAIVSMLVMTGVSQFAEPESELFIQLAILTGLLAGLIQLAMGVLRLGMLVNFLSHPVLSGFTSAAAVIIGLGQFKHFLGIEIERSSYVHEILWNIGSHIHETHLLTFGIGLGGIVLIKLLGKIHSAFPAALVTLFICTLAAYYLDWEAQGVLIIGAVPTGLPSFSIPSFTFEQMNQLIPMSITIALISFVESIAIAKTLEARHKDYKIDANQELVALGLAKFVGAFFQSFPTTGSFSRSFINDEAGSQTNIAGIISMVFVALVLIFFTPLFYFMPKAILASIIMISVFGLIDFKEPKYLLRSDRSDFIMLMMTFVTTLIMGIGTGILTGILFSLGEVILRSTKPHMTILGQIPNTVYYRNTKRYPEALKRKEMLIIRFDAELYFANVNHFKETLEEFIAAKGEELQVIILEASSIHALDSTGMHTLEEVIEDCANNDVSFYFTGVIGPVRDAFHKGKLISTIGRENQFMRVHDAVEYFDEMTAEKTAERNFTRALQTNYGKRKS